MASKHKAEVKEGLWERAASAIKFTEA